MVPRLAPGQYGNGDDRLKRRSFILHAVITGEKAMLVGVDRLHRAFPWTNLFVESAANIRNRVQIKVAADVFVMEAGAEQESRRVNGSACDYHRLAADGNA